MYLNYWVLEFKNRGLCCGAFFFIEVTGSLVEENFKTKLTYWINMIKVIEKSNMKSLIKRGGGTGPMKPQQQIH